MTNDDGGTSSSKRANESPAGTAPAIPDDALSPGQELPVPPSDEEVAAMARNWARRFFRTPGPIRAPRGVDER